MTSPMEPTNRLRWAKGLTEEVYDGQSVKCERIMLQQLWVPYPEAYPGARLHSGGEWRDVPTEEG